MVGALIVLAPLISLSLSSRFSWMSFSRSSSRLFHSSWARCMSVLSVFWMISRALALLVGVGRERSGNASLYGARSNSFGGGVGGLVRLISGSGWNGLNGGEENEDVKVPDVGSE